LIRFYFLPGLLALCLAAGCRAQIPASTPGGANDAADLNRRIEVMVRAQYNVPPEYKVELGTRKPGKIGGYDELPVTLTRGEKKTTVDFLIASDNKTLARLETFDLAKDPVFSINIAGRPMRGNPDAKVTIVNFDDLECPYCAPA